MIDELKNGLKELGFSEKESEVYLAMLELGPAAVQDIAKKAGVNRSTTYVMIESLKRRGLISTYEKGKKLFFVAESPGHLKLLLQDEIADLKAKQARLDAALPRLEAIYNARDDKPSVRFFEGEQAIIQLRKEIVESKKPIWEFYSVDKALMEITSIGHEERVRGTKHLFGRVLFTVKPGFEVPYFDREGIDVRTLPYDQFPFSGDLAIVGDRVYVMSMKSIGLTIVIKNEEMAEIVRTLYQAAWSCAQIWVPPADWGKKQEKQ